MAPRRPGPGWPPPGTPRAGAAGISRDRDEAPALDGAALERPQQQAVGEQPQDADDDDADQDRVALEEVGAVVDEAAEAGAGRDHLRRAPGAPAEADRRADTGADTGHRPGDQHLHDDLAARSAHAQHG